MSKNFFTSFHYSIFVLAMILPSCWSGEQTKTPRTKGLFVLNVLDSEWHDDCHIKGSINVPFAQLEEFTDNLDKEEADIVLYCSNYMCSSSGHGCRILAKKGFKSVSAYEGGTAEWYQRGLPVEGPAKKSYLTRQMSPPAHDDESCVVISAEKLAEKMGIEI